MKKKIVIVLTPALLLLGLAGIVNANVIDFNSATTGIYTHYEEDGFQLDSLVKEFAIIDVGGGGDNIAYIYIGETIRLTRIDGLNFNFNSIYFPSSNVNPVGTITSSKGGNYTFDITALPATFFTLGIPPWTNIEWLDITRTGGNFFDIDNINVDPVPEPATMFLLGTGLVGVAGAARRRKKNQA